MPRNRLAIRQIFQSGNPMGFPDLLPELCATEIPERLHPYGAGRDIGSNDAIHFFVEDFKFAGAWNYPERVAQAVMRARWPAVCEPDFSLWLNLPLAQQIHAIYQRRWCARKWQEYGATIIPILSAGDERTWGFAWDGIPQGCVVAMQVQTATDFGYLNAMLAKAIETVQPQTVLLYGRQRRELRIGCNHRWYEPFTVQMRRRLRSVQPTRQKP
jgi:hypothetical protein